MLSTGCGSGAAIDAQRKQLAAEQEARLHQLEELEIRLITVGARQRAWNELQVRHSNVSAIACANVAEHVAAMEAHDAKQREKQRAQRARRRAAAQASFDKSERPSIRTAAVEPGAAN
jgi:hypothetical protein